MIGNLNVYALSSTQLKKAKEVLKRLEDDKEVYNKTELEIMFLLKKYGLLNPDFLDDLDRI